MGDSVAVWIYKLLHVTILYLFLEFKKKKSVLDFQAFSFLKKSLHSYKNIVRCERFRILTAVLLKIQILWDVNPLNPELNPICYLLALLPHHFLHVSRIRVQSLTIRLLMSYIYIYIYIYIWSTYS